MKLIIVSDLVGTPGDEYHPTEGINVEALLDGGFIRKEKTTNKESVEN